MSTSSVKITGTKEVEAVFKALPKVIQNRIIREGIVQAARLVRDSARFIVPVATGALKRSIKVRTPRRKRRGQIRRKVAAGTDEKTKAYARLIERGNEMYTGANAKTVKQMAQKTRVAQPYLEPALHGNEEEIHRLIAQSVEEGIKDVK